MIDSSVLKAFLLLAYSIFLGHQNNHKSPHTACHLHQNKVSWLDTGDSSLQ